jgi:hypothetical protein
MASKFQIDIETGDGIPSVSVSGDVDKEGWVEEFLDGVDELLSMMSEMYGRSVVQERLKKHLTPQP